MTEYTYTKKDLDGMDEHLKNHMLNVLDRFEPKDHHQLECLYAIIDDLDMDIKLIRLENWTYEAINHAILELGPCHLSRHLEHVMCERDLHERQLFCENAEWEYYA